jgi:hypothetical protein
VRRTCAVAWKLAVYATEREAQSLPPYCGPPSTLIEMASYRRVELHPFRVGVHTDHHTVLIPLTPLPPRFSRLKPLRWKG